MLWYEYAYTYYYVYLWNVQRGVIVYGPGPKFLIPEVFGIQILKMKKNIISNYNERTPEETGKGENRHFENICLSMDSLGAVALLAVKTVYTFSHHMSVSNSITLCFLYLAWSTTMVQTKILCTVSDLRVYIIVVAYLRRIRTRTRYVIVSRAMVQIPCVTPNF